MLTLSILFIPSLGCNGGFEGDRKAFSSAIVGTVSPPLETKSGTEVVIRR